MHTKIQIQIILLISILFLMFQTMACGEVHTENETTAQESAFFNSSICPALTCSLYCENGFKVSSDGCDICACEENSREQQDSTDSADPSLELENEGGDLSNDSLSDEDAVNPNDDSSVAIETDAGTIAIGDSPNMDEEDSQDAGVTGIDVEGSPEDERDAGSPPPDNQDCMQVLQPALSPSGYCVIFPTPCEVPDEWTPVDSCD